MAKSKRDKKEDKEPGPDYGEQHEAITTQPGETPKSKNVFGNIVAAQRALGDRFNLEEIIDQVGLDSVDEKEGAYLQRRLRIERGIEFPENLRFDESVLGDVKAEPAVEAEPQAVVPGSAAEVAKQLREELLGVVVDELTEGFKDAKNNLKGFSIDEELKKNELKERLGDDGVKQVLEKLAQAGVTDLKEGGEEVKGEIHGRPPEAEQMPTGKLLFVRFEYKNGQLYVIRKSEKTGKELKPKLCTDRNFTLPKNFGDVAKDPVKLERALKGLNKLYVHYVRPVPGSWRVDGKIDYFEVYFPGMREAILLPRDVTKIEDVNRKIGALKAREQAGERIDYEKEGYWQAPGFDAWRNNQHKIIATEYIQERVKQGMADLGIDMDAAEPAQPDEEEPVVAPEPQEKAEPDDDVLPDPAGVMGDEILTPADVGMSEETAERIRAEVKESVIEEWAKILASKYPKMAGRGDAYVRNVAEDAMDETDLEDAFQKALVAYREWKKKK